MFDEDDFVIVVVFVEIGFLGVDDVVVGEVVFLFGWGCVVEECCECD